MKADVSNTHPTLNSVQIMRKLHQHVILAFTNKVFIIKALGRQKTKKEQWTLYSPFKSGLNYRIPDPFYKFILLDDMLNPGRLNIM